MGRRGASRGVVVGREGKKVDGVGGSTSEARGVRSVRMYWAGLGVPRPGGKMQCCPKYLTPSQGTDSASYMRYVLRTIAGGEHAFASAMPLGASGCFPAAVSKRHMVGRDGQRDDKPTCTLAYMYIDD